MSGFNMPPGVSPRDIPGQDDDEDPTTMDEMYGDGSAHPVCQKCGYCIQCGDCEKFGCGRFK